MAVLLALVLRLMYHVFPACSLPRHTQRFCASYLSRLFSTCSQFVVRNMFAQWFCDSYISGLCSTCFPFEVRNMLAQRFCALYLSGFLPRVCRLKYPTWLRSSFVPRVVS